MLLKNVKGEKIESYVEYVQFVHQMLDDEKLNIGFGEYYDEEKGIYNQCSCLTFDEAFEERELMTHEDLDEFLACSENEDRERMQEMAFYKFTPVSIDSIKEFIPGRKYMICWDEGDEYITFKSIKEKISDKEAYIECEQKEKNGIDGAGIRIDLGDFDVYEVYR